MRPAHLLLALALLAPLPTLAAPTSTMVPGGDAYTYIGYSCGDCCVDVGCTTCQIFDRQCFGGRFTYAANILLTWMTAGTLVGLGGGAILGVVPGVIFAGLSLGASAQGGAEYGAALQASLLSFCGTLLLTSLILGLVGFFLGGAIGVVIAAVEFVLYEPPGRRRHPRRRHRELPPRRPDRPRHPPPRDEPDDYPDDEPQRPPGDAPPPLAMAF